MSDNELIEQAKAGDQHAFGVLYEKYSARIFNYIAKFIGNAELAQEATQNTFLVVFKNLHLYRPGPFASPWIFGIASNTAKQFYRQKLRTSREVSLDQPTSPSAEGEDEKSLADYLKTNELDPREALRQKEYHEHIQTILDALPEKYRDALVLHDIEQIPYEEIQKILKLPRATIAKRLSRARVLFRKRIDPDRLGIRLFMIRRVINEIWVQIAGSRLEKLFMTDAMIALYADGELSESKSQRIKGFIHERSDLRESLRFMEETKLILKDMPKLYPSAILRSQVLDLISKEPPATHLSFLTAPLQLLDMVSERTLTAPRPLVAMVLAGLIAVSSSVTMATWIEHERLPTVTDVSGNPVQIVEGTPVVLKRGLAIQAGRLIKTGKNEKLILKRKDLFTLGIDEETSLILSRMSHVPGVGTNDVILATGTILFKTESKLMRGQFQVTTPWFIASHQGTVASFTLNPEILRVAVLNGKMKLAATEELRIIYAKPIIVSEGEEFIYERKTKKIIHRAISDESLKSLADFGASEEVVLLGLPPEGKAEALFGQDQKILFAFYNIKEPDIKKKIEIIKNAFKTQVPDSKRLADAVVTLKEVAGWFGQKGRSDIEAKLDVMAAAISVYLGQFNQAIEVLAKAGNIPKADAELRALAMCGAGTISDDRLNDPKKAKVFYDAAVNISPDTSAGKEAKQKLARMNRVMGKR